MKTMPQEIEVWYVLPQIRRAIAMEMKKRKLSQLEIARMLDVTPSAVSQYVNSKRAKANFFTNDIFKKISKAVDKIIKNEDVLYNEIQSILTIVRDRGLLCKIHKCYEAERPEECNICGR
jgi:uncharacterized protein